MKHPDLAVVQAEGRSVTLKVEQVRDLHRSLSLAPYEARYRVALLLNFEQAHPSAANALLKTLEEPPPQVILLLTAESPESLLPTIVSRCETLRLRASPLEAVAQGLQTRWELDPERARLLAHISGGRPGYAVRLQKEADGLERRQARLDEHAQMLGASRVERFAYAETLAKEKEVLREALLFWLSLWRDVLIRAAGASAPIANLDRETEVEHLASRAGMDTARRTIACLQRILALLDVNINTRLAAEVLMLDLPAPAEMDPPDER
jgi:DNA polymerase-3 subunit delta'